MKRNLVIKQHIKDWLFSILGWLLIFYFYYVVFIIPFKEFIRHPVLLDYMSDPASQLEIILSAVIYGLLFGVINSFTEFKRLRRYSLFNIVLIKSLLYMLALVIVYYVVLNIFIYFNVLSRETIDVLFSIYQKQFTIPLLIYIFFFNAVFNFYIQLNKKLGRGNLLSLITGKYQHPVEQDLFFLFVDLKNSTSIAEKLGHVEYSRFIRECYHDITNIVLKRDASIYQYVGDEVVLFWDKESGMAEHNCFHTLFEINDLLKEKSEYYKTEFGFLPEFTAGLDFGRVTKVEVGDLKREIAFHGDVLNTASRIQEQCRANNKQLLVSEKVDEKIQVLNGFKKDLVEEMTLRGKEKRIKIFAIDKK